MGYDSTALGIYFSHSLDWSLFFKLIASKVTIVSADGTEQAFVDGTSEEYYPEESKVKLILRQDIVADRQGEILDSSLLIMDWDDVDFEYGFHYAANPKVMIGCASCCAFMIYLRDTATGCTYNSRVAEVDTQALTDLLTWRTTLIQDGRMGSQYTLKMVNNCCS